MNEERLTTTQQRILPGKVEPKPWYKRLSIVLSLPILAIFSSFFLVLTSGEKVNVPLQEEILRAEGYFCAFAYKEALLCYEKALSMPVGELAGFLQIRQKMASHLLRMKEWISAGEAAEVDKLLVIGKEEGWSEEMNQIYVAHCQTFIQQIEKLNDYKKSIQQTVAFLEAKQSLEAQSKLKESIRLAKFYRTSFAPLRKEILRCIRSGNNEALLLTWRFQQDLGLEISEIRNALGDEKSFLPNAEKLLGQGNTEVAIILKQLLSYPERAALAQQYFSHEKNSQAALSICLILDPFLSEAYYASAQQLVSQGKYEESIGHYEKAQSTYAAKALTDKGWCELYQKKVVDALASWEKALAYCPEFSSAHLALTIFYFLLGNTTKAQYHREKMQETGNSAANVFLQQVLENRPPEVFPTGLPEGPLGAYFQLCLAVSLFSRDETERALSAYEKAKKIFLQYHISPIEVLVYEGILYDKIKNQNELEAVLKELSQYQEKNKEAVLFYSLLYERGQKKEPESFLPPPWKELWEKTRQPLDHKEDDHGRK